MFKKNLNTKNLLVKRFLVRIVLNSKLYVMRLSTIFFLGYKKNENVSLDTTSAARNVKKVEETITKRCSESYCNKVLKIYRKITWAEHFFTSSGLQLLGWEGMVKGNILYMKPKKMRIEKRFQLVI